MDEIAVTFIGIISAFLAMKLALLYRKVWELEDRINEVEDWSNLRPIERPRLGK